jgi:hypothetical protein
MKVRRWRPRIARAAALTLLVLSSSLNLFHLTSPQLRDSILEFYPDCSLPIETRKDPVRWQVVLTDLGKLEALTPSQAE